MHFTTLLLRPAGNIWRTTRLNRPCYLRGRGRIVLLFTNKPMVCQHLPRHPLEAEHGLNTFTTQASSNLFKRRDIHHFLALHCYTRFLETSSHYCPKPSPSLTQLSCPREGQGCMCTHTRRQARSFKIQRNYSGWSSVDEFNDHVNTSRRTGLYWTHKRRWNRGISASDALLQDVILYLLFNYSFFCSDWFYLFSFRAGSDDVKDKIRSFN